MASLRAMQLMSKSKCISAIRCSHVLVERRSLCKWSPVFAKNEIDTHTEATMNSIRSRDVQFNARHVQEVDEDAIDTKHELSYDETSELRSKESNDDARMRIYESNNINLSSCMQSTVPQPFDGTTSGSDHVSPINMPGGGSRRDDKYLSGDCHDTHQSRHFSTFVRKMQANNDHKTNKKDSEFVVKARFLEDSLEYQYGYFTLKSTRDFLLSFTIVYAVVTGIAYIVYYYCLLEEVPLEKIVNPNKLAKQVSKLRGKEDGEFDGLSKLETCHLLARCHLLTRVCCCAIIAHFVTFAALQKKWPLWGPIKSAIKFDKWLKEKVKES